MVDPGGSRTDSLEISGDELNAIAYASALERDQSCLSS
jgi:hypothetical protein